MLVAWKSVANSVGRRCFSHFGDVVRTNKDVKVMKYLKRMGKYAYNKRLYKKDDGMQMEIPPL